MGEGNKRIITESIVSISEEHFSPTLKARLWEVPTPKC